ncbi:MAG: hypothetical protein Q4C64_04130 [Erysipelotrichia bacterium]|nr:hypothetical protein [Erysipelotrichia bacterium]
MKISLFNIIMVWFLALIIGVMVGLCLMCISTKIRCAVNRFFYGEYEEEIIEKE